MIICSTLTPKNKGPKLDILRFWVGSYDVKNLCAL
jgi:hypothetical protein